MSTDIFFLHRRAEDLRSKKSCKFLNIRYHPYFPLCLIRRDGPLTSSTLEYLPYKGVVTIHLADSWMWRSQVGDCPALVWVICPPADLLVWKDQVDPTAVLYWQPDWYTSEPPRDIVEHHQLFALLLSSISHCWSIENLLVIIYRAI